VSYELIASIKGNYIRDLTGNITKIYFHVDLVGP